MNTLSTFIRRVSVTIAQFTSSYDPHCSFSLGREGDVANVPLVLKIH